MTTDQRRGEIIKATSLLLQDYAREIASLRDQLADRDAAAERMRAALRQVQIACAWLPAYTSLKVSKAEWVNPMVLSARIDAALTEPTPSPAAKDAGTQRPIHCYRCNYETVRYCPVCDVPPSTRAAVIEECAKVAEKVRWDDWRYGKGGHLQHAPSIIAEAIRAIGGAQP